MLTELRIQNFKAWKDTGAVAMKPLTVIFGANSAGKSSLGDLLFALKQTALSGDRKRALHLGDPHSPVDLGTFTDCLHRHDASGQLGFTLGWRPPGRVSIANPLADGARYEADTLRLEAALRADPNGLPSLAWFRYELRDREEPQLRVWHGYTAAGTPDLAAEPMPLVAAAGRDRPIAAPEKFYRFSQETLARYRNADGLAQLPLELERLLAGLIRLSPLREPPRRSYRWAGDAVSDVGARGESSIAALLAATAQQRKLSRGPGRAPQRFDEFIAGWLAELGLIAGFRVRPVAAGHPEYEVRVRARPGAPELRLTDVGFGIAQVLPALVQAYYAAPDSTIWMEQPEIHLHPRAQAALADAFIGAVQAYENDTPRNVQLVVESHSEHFLLRLQRRVAEEHITPDEVAVYFVREDDDGVALEALRLDASGEIENWPADFFGDELAEIAARTEAAMRKRLARTDARG